jgi:hypothetical protein
MERKARRFGDFDKVQELKAEFFYVKTQDNTNSGPITGLNVCSHKGATSKRNAQNKGKMLLPQGKNTILKLLHHEHPSYYKLFS